MAKIGPLVFAALATCFIDLANAEYIGKFLGKLSELHHKVSGEVYVVDGRTIHIKDFTYDGQGPAAYFYASTYKTADSRGFRLRDENNNGDVIRRYRKEGVTLTLPEGKNLNNIKIFYVWCEEFDVNFGDIKIPRNFDFPRPQKIDALKGVHSISSDNIVIVDAQTLLIPNLHYDGEAPDAKFWVGRGPKPSPQGIRVPDENGKEVPLRRYDAKTVVLTLPGDLTVFDIGHFGIWCEQFTVDFGHVQIPQVLNIPPSLKMLGVSPQSKLNCEVLDEDSGFEVRWAVAGESIVLQLVAKLGDREYMSFGLSGEVSRSVMIGGDVVVAWVDKETLKGYAEDYYLKDKSQCSGPTGSCPDTKFEENTNNVRLLNAAMVNGYSIVTYQRPLKASDQYDLPIYTNQSQAILWAIGPLNQRDEVSFHTSYLKKDSFIDFARPAKWNCPLPEGESAGHHPVPLQNKEQEIVRQEIAEPSIPEPIQEFAEPSTTAAPRREGGNRRRGGTRRPVATTESGEEVQASRRETTRTRGSNRVNQRGTAQTVPPPTPVKEKREPWFIPPIECNEPDDGVFYAQLGPTGGKRGYPAITGHVGWGISWYINGLLIPEINVVRGITYNFVVEGGENPEIPAKYHPFYITDDPIGGYAYKTPEERKNITIFSGVRLDKDGEAIPTGTGRLCHWAENGDVDANDFDSFGAYQRTLQLDCEAGEPGLITWTPDRNTPNTVYYQCFSHRHLGWKINVLDSCDKVAAASEVQYSVVQAPESDNFNKFSDESDIELEASPSIRQEATVMPNPIILEDITSDNRSQPAISEVVTTTLDPSPTRTSQPKSDQIPNTSLSFQSPQSHSIDSFANPSLLNSTIKQRMTITQQPFIKLTTKPPNTFATVKKFALKMQPQKPYSVQMKQPYFKSKTTQITTIKKPVYRQTNVRFHENRDNTQFNTKQAFMKPLPFYISIPINAQLISAAKMRPAIIKNVEISPQQASTEREPEIHTANPTLPFYSTESEKLNNKSGNNGFKPESIVMESGFKPIIGILEDKVDNIEPEVDPEGESGVIKISGRKKLETLHGQRDINLLAKLKFAKAVKNPIVPKQEEMKLLIIHPRNIIDSDIEPEMAAADRVESYYLPPPGQTEKPKIANQPSEIDFEAPSPPEVLKNNDVSSSSKLAVSPPDIVVTFDGKTVSGASLTAKPFEKSFFFQRGSKAAELLKAHPQSVPFRGDLPPLNPTVLFNSNPVRNSGVLNRDLDTPLPSSGTTKLRQLQG